MLINGYNIIWFKACFIQLAECGMSLSFIRIICIYLSIKSVGSVDSLGVVALRCV